MISQSVWPAQRTGTVYPPPPVQLTLTMEEDEKLMARGVVDDTLVEEEEEKEEEEVEDEDEDEDEALGEALGTKSGEEVEPTVFCCVCRDDETDEDNPILLCDGGCGHGKFALRKCGGWYPPFSTASQLTNTRRPFFFLTQAST